MCCDIIHDLLQLNQDMPVSLDTVAQNYFWK